jgi:hypothetical protein
MSLILTVTAERPWDQVVARVDQEQGHQGPSGTMTILWSVERGMSILLHILHFSPWSESGIVVSYGFFIAANDHRTGKSFSTCVRGHNTNRSPDLEAAASWASTAIYFMERRGVCDNGVLYIMPLTDTLVVNGSSELTGLCRSGLCNGGSGVT